MARLVNSRELSAASAWRSRRPVYSIEQGQLVLDASYRPSISRRLLYAGVHHLRLLEVANEVRRIWTVRQIRQSAGRDRKTLDLGTASHIYAPPADAVWRDAWNVTESLLARINDEVAARGARFVVTTITMAEQVHPDEGVRRGLESRPGIQDMLYPDRRISEIGRKYGFAVVVLAERMRQIASQEGVFFHGFENTVMGQGHWWAGTMRIAGKNFWIRCMAGATSATSAARTTWIFDLRPAVRVLVYRLADAKWRVALSGFRRRQSMHKRIDKEGTRGVAGADLDSSEGYLTGASPGCA